MVEVLRTPIFDQWKTMKTSVYDPAEYIETKEDVIAFLEGALEENDPEFLLETIGHIARSKGMAQVAKELNIDNLGFRLSIQQKQTS